MARFVSPITDMKPLGHLLFYKSKTNTELVTYKDELETIENTTQVAVNADGNVANVFFSGSAKVKYFDQFGVQYAERDPVGGTNDLGNFGTWISDISFDKNDFTEASNGRFYKSLVNGNEGNDPTLDPGANDFWEEVLFTGVWNSKITYKINNIVLSALGYMWVALTAEANNNPDTDDGTNWRSANNSLWLNKSAAFDISSNKKYMIDASGGTIDAALKTSYKVGDTIIVHNIQSSSNLVRLTNTALTIIAPAGTVTTSDNIVLLAGNTIQMVAKTTTILQIVGAKI